MERRDLVLGSLASNSARELHVLREDGDALGVNGAKVGVLEESNKICLSCLLKGSNGSTLEAKIGLHFLGNLANEALKGKLADEQLCGLLKTANLAQRNDAGAITMGLFDTSLK